MENRRRGQNSPLTRDILAVFGKCAESTGLVRASKCCKGLKSLGLGISKCWEWEE